MLGDGVGEAPKIPALPDWPSMMLSSCTVSWVGPPRIWLTEATRPALTPFAGGNGPLNLPVAGSIVGTVVLVRSPLRPLVVTVTSTSPCWFGDSGVGVTALVFRCDSRLDGPEATEFTSNALTA